ncbi:ATP-binding protein [Marinilabiliaceae bacterium ANBcel2]|nr:ATP-binding protein [Marinilabiliaceae bacterium ANBcel2]
MFQFKKLVLTLSTLLIAILIAAITLSYGLDSANDNSKALLKIEEKINGLREQMKTLSSSLPEDSFSSHQSLWEKISTYSSDEISLAVYQNNELIAWSNNQIPLQGINPGYFDHPVVKLDNGWFLSSSTSYDENIKVVAFALLKKDYPFQNKYLQNSFNPLFNINSSVLITRDGHDDYLPVYDENGEYLFSFIVDDYLKYGYWWQRVAGYLYLLSLIIIFLLCDKILRRFKNHDKINLIFLTVTSVFLLFFYVVFWHFNLYPKDYSNIFTPYYFAMSSFLPSLGHFVIFALLLFITSMWFYRYFKIPLFNFFKHRIITVGVPFCLILLSIFFLIYINSLFYDLAKHSSGTFVITGLADIDFAVFVKLLLFALLLSSFIFLFDKVVITALYYLSLKQLTLIISVVIFLFVLLYRGFGKGDSDFAFLFYFASFLILALAKRDRMIIYSYSTFLWLSFLFALYIGSLFTDLSIREEEQNRELLAENLTFRYMQDEDPVAEIYLEEIEYQIINDATLMRMVADSELDIEMIRNHLMKFYFYGFWQRYDMQVIPCWPQGDLYIEDTAETINCYDYFFYRLDNIGYNIAGGNHFYYLDNFNGRSTYFGVFRFFPDNPERETTLFIELNSKPFFEGSGYPELLISESDQQYKELLSGYSYAKYIDGDLVRRGGEYNYKTEAHFYNPVLHSKFFMKDGDYSHLVYQPSESITVVISREDYSISNIFISFSIYFLYFLAVGIIFLLIIRWKLTGFNFNLSIQKRIQVAFVSLMLLMLIVIASGTVHYTVKQYRNKHIEMLENKVQSVLMELEYKVGIDGPETYAPEDYLNYQLQMISNVFNCDINLYGIDGKLTGTSRPELFGYGISGARMNPTAYQQLLYGNAVRHLEDEVIGNMDYLSFYVPVITSDNQLAGFVNLPYFVGNNELKNEISSVIVTVINFYILFSFIVIVFAVFLSKQITRPLLMLQQKISGVKLGYANEEIDYKGKDEIGDLVIEYNRMVKELESSAEKLARTERDTAWREMAKQIAHEIKNPLTPMKLSIQYLQKAWENSPENFDSYLKNVSNTLIEQINSLSSIATEFSKFAKMPKARMQYVNIMERLRSSINLFSEAQTDNISFTFMDNDFKELIVKADGEQLLAVFNNLIKNAVQAISCRDKGEVIIGVNKGDNVVTVFIKDNGKGISEEIKDKIFEPNFTTKSGGMGLGLAISRRIVESFNGKIWFETDYESGTTFYIELPLQQK